MSLPFHLEINQILRFGDRKIRFLGEIGDGILKFRYTDGDEDLVRVPTSNPAEASLPTIEWILARFRAGEIIDPCFNRNCADRSDRFLHLDRIACISIDQKSAARFDWADLAISAGIKRTERSARRWLATILDGPHEKPNPRSLLRWMKRLTDGGGRIGALVNCAGREKGQSQLSDVEDRLIHKWALRYWRAPTPATVLANKEDAATMVILEWDELVKRGIPFLGAEAPSSEAVRKRINSLECYSMHVSRYGRTAADKKYLPNGEPVPVSRPFERIFMDGTEYSHSLFYSSSLTIPSAKMKGVMAMDVFSQFVFPFPVFSGPFRPEMGLGALRSVMTPPEFSPADLASDPQMGLFFGLPSDIMIDRDRTLITPSMVPNTLTITNTIELAEAYHSDAKSKLENFHKFVKQKLRHIPGLILGPEVKHKLGYNPIAATRLTRSQYVDQVEQCRREWNATPKKSLGGLSPDDIMRAHLHTNGPRLTDPLEVWRALSSTPAKKCVLTVNGLTYDKIHYRWNQDGVAAALSANACNMPFKNRIAGSAKVEVTIRTWPDNIDFIEVYDEENLTYHRLYSTDPGYTGGLSRWEHHIYQKHLHGGEGPAKARRTRNRSRAQFLKARMDALSTIPFRDRELPTALMELEERRMSGKRADNPLYGQVPELYIATEAGGKNREETPKPPPQTASDKEFDGPAGADDTRSDPTEAIRFELGHDDPEILISPHNRWDFSDDDALDEDDGE